MHDWRADVRARLASARLHPQDEAEIVDEVAQHLEEQFVELAPAIGAGAARERLLAELRDTRFDDAAAGRRRRARPSRAQSWSSTSVLRDIRYGLRSLRRSPGMVAAGVGALALGIGLTTVMYSIIYGTLIKGLPFDDASRIAMVYHTDEASHPDLTITPWAEFVRYRAAQRDFEAFGAFYQGAASVSGGDRPERVTAAWMTAGAFEITRVRALLGRTFTPADNSPSAPPTAVLAYSMWRDRFAADSNVVGKTLRVDQRAYTIIGVMPERYEFPQSAKLWLPVQLDTTLAAHDGERGVVAFARLRDGVSFETASAELTGLSRRLASERPAAETHDRAVALPYVRGMMPTRVYSLFFAMLGAVFLVLLVACANVANLLLDRAANRSREIGIRIALGASRLAVVRQSLVESTILALLAAVVGTGLAQAGIVAFNRATVDVDRPFWMDIRLHAPVLVFVLGVALLASVVSGLLPAIQSARLDINTILKDESHAASSLRVGKLSRTIVVAEIALSSTMLLAAGFMTKSITRLRAIDPHFASAGVFTARINLGTTDTIRRRAFFETLDAKLRATPGLEGVYLGSGLPGTGWGGDRVALEGHVYTRPRDYGYSRSLAVTPGFFTTFNVTPLRGRAIASTDRMGSPRVAVVSEAFVKRFFPETDPIGRRVRLGQSDSSADWVTIVGVMPTLYAAALSLQNPWLPEVLTAFWQGAAPGAAAVALRGPPGIAAAAPLRTLVASLDPDIPVYETLMMDDVLAKPTWPVRVFGSMFVIFGVVSLLLAAIGLYAVMAFSVSRRVREMGIRMALGATSRDVVTLVCRQGALQIVVGMSIGFVAGAGVVRMARMVLFDVQPGDPTVFLLVAGVLGGAAFVACIIPALGATRVDPVIALRAE